MRNLLANRLLGNSSIRRAVLLSSALIVGGCAAGGPTVRQTLSGGFADLAAGRNDRALSAADEFLQQHPQGGSGSAEAYYLRGRVYELRASASANSADASATSTNLQAARAAYTKALEFVPAPALEASIRSQLANVAYFQDDYRTALTQWREAYAKLDTLGQSGQDAKPWALYRIGLCEQRLGKFVDADKTFGQVKQTFPTSEPARRAADHVGARAFSIQVGAFATAANADSVVQDLRKKGIAPQRTVDPFGREVVRVGPLPTYDQARIMRKDLAAQYPGAVIVP